MPPRQQRQRCGLATGGLSSNLDDGQDIGGDNSGTHGGGGACGSLFLRCGELLSDHLLYGWSTMMSNSGSGLDCVEGRGEGGWVKASGRGKSSRDKGVGGHRGVGRVGAGVVRGRRRIHGGADQGDRRWAGVGPTAQAEVTAPCGRW
jgi:hypothetical protein